ncbi:hypothetical protein V490_05601 [Pseudogymnoascus sp. VKM F-3557]|nr:hypothetical protein V490_05601 [Pseudogymnoascus sp. VKM F-3557]
MSVPIPSPASLRFLPQFRSLARHVNFTAIRPRALAAQAISETQEAVGREGAASVRRRSQADTMAQHYQKLPPLEIHP